MADKTWLDQQFTSTSSGTENIVHPETDTKNIVDWSDRFGGDLDALINKIYKAKPGELASLDNNTAVPKPQLRYIYEDMATQFNTVNNTINGVSSKEAKDIQDLKDAIAANTNLIKNGKMYVKLTGDTMSGDLNLPNLNATGTITTSNKLTKLSSNGLEISSSNTTRAPVVVKSYASNFTASTAKSATLLDANGNTTFPGDLTALRVHNAIYNDYAEFFEKGEDTEIGDIIALDMTSDKEKYVKATKYSKVIVGIHTEEFAQVIGGNKDSINKNKEEFIPISLMGRVHVKVKGPVYKGDYINPSDIPGVGESSIFNEKAVGISLENNKEPGIRLIKVLVTHYC